MTFFTTPMARQFVGFDSLFDELNEMAHEKSQTIPYNIAKDDDEHYRMRLHSLVFAVMISLLKLKKAC